MAETMAVQADGVARLVLRGDFDLADYDAITAEVRRLEAEAPRVLAVDLREVGYIDSTGVRWLVETNDRARMAGRRLLVLHTAGEAVERVIRLCRLDEVLELIEGKSRASAA